MIIRNARATDLEAIVTVHVASWRNAFRGLLSDAYLDSDILGERLVVWQNRFDSPKANQHTVITEDETDILGFAHFYINHDERYGTFLDNLHVLPEHKGQGIGKRLLRTVAAISVEAFPNAGLWLWVRERNTAARGVYEHLGAKTLPSAIISTADGTSVAMHRMHWPDPRILGDTLD
jgi:ribosomal protein S18 acetylase RimI-like enzyme